MPMKNIKILEEIGFKYLPDMFPTPTSRRLAKKFPKAFNVEHIVELAISEMGGGIHFVDAHGYDHDDGSETKTASVRLNPNKPGQHSHRWEISNVARAKLKLGDLRVVMFNPLVYDLKYFFIPVAEWSQLSINYHPTNKMGRIFGSWNASSNSYNSISKFEVPDFGRLALAKSTVEF